MPRSKKTRRGPPPPFPPLPDWEVLDEELQDHKFDLGKIAASLWRYYSVHGQHPTEGSILSIR
ncbi:hypothetical protein BDZ91DRAFT_748737, partial [Kalaharituber pfeilii]